MPPRAAGTSDRDTAPASELGDFLRDHRMRLTYADMTAPAPPGKRRGYPSIEAVASELGMSAAMYARYEHGSVKTFTMPCIRRLTRVLKLDAVAHQRLIELAIGIPHSVPNAAPARPLLRSAS